MQKVYYKSPIGWMEIAGDGKAVSSVVFVSRPAAVSGKKAAVPALLRRCAKELDEYFRGKRTGFSVPVRLEGTCFQSLVWDKLRRIRYGHRASYRELAAAVGAPRAARAVGGALNKNKIAVVIPCHRVIGHGGDLTGYAAGVWRKRRLLDHERRVVTRDGRI